MTNTERNNQPVIAGLLALTLTTASLVADAREPGIAPDALQRLKASLEFLEDQQAFRLSAQTTIEAVLDSGQKIQFDTAVNTSVRRPDRMYAQRVGDLVDQEFFFDGKRLTLHDPVNSYHATVEAPDNLDDMLDFARQSLDIVAPAGDFIHADAYEILTEDLQSGFVVGPAFVEGSLCDHLAFSAPGTDWQVWIQQGEKPLLRRLVITSRDIMSAPQFTVHVRDWDLDPDLSKVDFTYEDQGDTNAIEFIFVDTDGQ